MLKPFDYRDCRILITTPQLVLIVTRLELNSARLAPRKQVAPAAGHLQARAAPSCPEPPTGIVRDCDYEGRCLVDQTVFRDAFKPSYLPVCWPHEVNKYEHCFCLQLA